MRRFPENGNISLVSSDMPQYELADGWRIARYQLQPGMYVLESAVPVAVVIGQRSWGLNAGVQP